MNALTISRILSQTAFSADQIMPTTELGWVELAVRQWGIYGAALALFAWFAVAMGKWAGPRIDKRLDAHNALIDAATARTLREDARGERLEQAIELMARMYEQIAGVVIRNCGKHEPPPSDTKLEALTKTIKASGAGQ